MGAAQPSSLGHHRGGGPFRGSHRPGLPHLRPIRPSGAHERPGAGNVVAGQPNQKCGRDAQHQGGLLVLYPVFEHVNAPAVLSNGSALYDFEEGRMIYQTFLRAQAPADLAELARHCRRWTRWARPSPARWAKAFLRAQAPADLAELARAFPEIGFEAYHGEDIYVFQPNAVTQAHMAKVGTDYTLCPEIDGIPTPSAFLYRLASWHCPLEGC